MDNLFSTEEETGRAIDNFYPWMKPEMFNLVTSVKQLEDLVNQAIASGKVAVDIETEGLNTRLDLKTGKPIQEIVGIGFSFKEHEGWYAPIFHRNIIQKKDPKTEEVTEEEHFYEANLDKEAVLKLFNKLVNNVFTLWHNWKFDAEFFHVHGVNCPTVLENKKLAFGDTYVKGVLYDSFKKKQGLKVLSEEYLDMKMLTIKQVAGDAKGDVYFGRVDPALRICQVYACSDVICTYLLDGKLDTLIAEEYKESKEYILSKGKKLYEDSKFKRDFDFIYSLERKVIRSVRNMERTLVQLDMDFLREKEKELIVVRQELGEKIFKVSGYKFNIDSDDLAKVLLENGVPLTKVGKDGKLLLEKEILYALEESFPICGEVVKWREASKTLNTYVKNLLANADANGQIKVILNQLGTDTGRFSAKGGKGLHVDGGGKVNIQNIPPVLRRAFVAREGYNFCCVDFSGQELRIMANVSKETKWIDEYLNAENPDIHGQTATLVFGTKEGDKGFKKHRKNSKAINFGVLYGAGEFTISKQINVPVEEAKDFLIKYMSNLPEIRKFIAQALKDVFNYGEVYTKFGRRRKFKGMKDVREALLDRNTPVEEKKLSYRKRGSFERAGQNFLIQGEAANILKIGLLRLFAKIKENGWGPLEEGGDGSVRILYTVHDEVDFEVRKDRMHLLPELINTLTLYDVLQGKFKWDIPLTVDCEYGLSWDVTNDYFKENPEKILELEVSKVDTKQFRDVRAKFEKKEPKEETETNEKLPATKSKIKKFEGSELISEYRESVLGVKHYAYKLKNPINENSLKQLKFLMEYSMPGNNPFTLLDSKGAVVVEGILLEALHFEVLARFHNF